MLLAAMSYPAQGCARVSTPGADIQVVDEAAVILWDAAAQRERFIRHANFRSSTENFGFLVPTPSEPTLTEANPSTFPLLVNLIRPKVIEKSERSYEAVSILSFLVASNKAEATNAAPASGSKGVEVLHTQTVGGYDAAVLSADNATALQRWLKEHGYQSDPALVEWLHPYIQAHWKITAFKISKESANSSSAATPDVELSFHTQKPFFPYREPASERTSGSHGPRSLRVFLLSSVRLEGRLGTAGSPDSWPGQLNTARPLTENEGKILQEPLGLPSQNSSGSLWLTAYEDRSSPRPGTDEVFFAPAAQQTVVTPPPVIVPVQERVPVPVEPIVLLGSLGLLFGLRLKRSLKAKVPPRLSERPL